MAETKKRDPEKEHREREDARAAARVARSERLGHELVGEEKKSSKKASTAKKPAAEKTDE